MKAIYNENDLRELAREGLSINWLYDIMHAKRRNKEGDVIKIVEMFDNKVRVYVDVKYLEMFVRFGDIDNYREVQDYLDGHASWTNQMIALTEEVGVKWTRAQTGKKEPYVLVNK